LFIKDANGLAVGQALGPLDVLMHTSAGQAFEVQIVATGFVQLAGLYYLSTNCTGTAHVASTVGYEPQVIPRARVIGTTAYIPGVQQITPAFFQSTSTGAACTFLPNGAPTPAAAAVVGTVDLSAFTPPFSLQ